MSAPTVETRSIMKRPQTGGGLADRVPPPVRRSRHNAFDRGDQFALRPVVAERSYDAALEDYQDTVTDAQFLDIVADQQHSRPLRTGALNDGEQRFLCRNIDALRRVDEDQNGRRRSERPSHDRLLLVAPAKFTDRLLNRRAHNSEGFDKRVGGVVSTFRRDQTETLQPFHDRNREIFGDRKMRQDPSS